VINVVLVAERNVSREKEVKFVAASRSEYWRVCHHSLSYREKIIVGKQFYVKCGRGGWGTVYPSLI
jgi:hypothetical protein